MGISLRIEITSPIDARDHELLSGIAVMTLAIANHELAEQKFPEAFGENETADEPTEAPEPEPVKLCGVLADPPDGDMICITPVGPSGKHRGRHAFRPIPTGDQALAN